MADESSYTSDFEGWSGGQGEQPIYAGYQDWGGADYLNYQGGEGINEIYPSDFTGYNYGTQGGQGQIEYGQTYNVPTGGSLAGGRTYQTDITGQGTPQTPTKQATGTQTQPLNTRTRTSYLYGGIGMPTYNAPSFNMPAYDINRVNFLTGQQAAPQMTRQRNALYAGMGKIAATENPYLQAKARKDLLQSYGGGISDIMAGASRTGQQLYQPEYQGQVTAAQETYRGGLQSSQAMFQAAIQEWLKSLTTETTTERY